ncbi:MAG: alpha/beta hydrolase [Myxococcota bacterium]
MRNILTVALAFPLLSACGDEEVGTPNAGATTAAQVREDCAGTFDVSDVDAPATFRVDGTRLVVRGVYVDATSAELFRLLDANPGVRTLVLANMGGSDVSMEGNLVGGREVRRRGLGTCVPAGGLVASGGSDFLLSGQQRAVFAGGRVGVHSWAGDDGNGMEVVATQFPRDSDQHLPFLSYYRDIGIADAFYWFTLEAAPPDGMYFMSRQEMTQFAVFTFE